MSKWLSRTTAALLVALATSCATQTKLTDVWKSDSATGAMSNILVIAIAKDQARRRTFEDAFVVSLTDKGVQAESSYLLLPDEEELTKESIQASIKGRSFQGVIVTRLLGIDNKETYVPPRSYTAPVYRGMGLYGYYGQTFQVVTEPGYTVQSQEVRLETNLYRADNAELVWAANSGTLNPASPEDGIRSVTDRLTSRLVADGMIKGS